MATERQKEYWKSMKGKQSVVLGKHWKLGPHTEEHIKNKKNI